MMKIDVSPDMPMYNLLRSYPYDLAGALSEYIDNSLQAYLDAPEKIRKEIGVLEVSIEVQLKDKHSQYIKVTDNGVGISSEALQRAMKPGFKPERQSLHEFGIGMKAASVWLGREWDLSTYPIGHKKVYSLDFNLDELISKNQKKVDVLESFATSEDAHGVSITVNKLRDISQEEVVAACTDLHDIYQIFIYRDKVLKLTFTLDDTSEDLMSQKVRTEPEPLRYPKAYLLKPSWSDDALAFKCGDERLWKKDISFSFNGLPVTGFVTVRKEASQANNPGLALFRYKRLIQGSETKEYRPKALLGSQNKAAPSKIYMELHLDGQQISHTKGKFNFDEQRLLQILKKHEIVKEFIDQAEAHRPSYEKRKAVIKCVSKEDMENKLDALKLKNQAGKSSSTKAKAFNGVRGNREKSTPHSINNDKKNNPIDILSLVNTPNSIIIEDITKEAVDLYNMNKNWSFALCYRVVLEKLMHEKIKVAHPQLYTDNLSDKGIAALLKYLHSNQHLLDGSKWKALRRSLNTLSKDDLIDITNLASHGHNKPSREKLDTLLLNTQELVKWSLDN